MNRVLIQGFNLEPKEHLIHPHRIADWLAGFAAPAGFALVIFVDRYLISVR
jgi:hypothetical protein